MMRNIAILMVSVFCSGLLYAKPLEVSLLHNWMIENYKSIELDLSERKPRN